MNADGLSAGVVGARLAERALRQGPVPFDEVVDEALYGDGGFYTSGGGAGRGRDFLTSVEVGPLFGALVARALDAWWHDLEEPDPFVVVEGGAGAGRLCASVLASPDLACRSALVWVGVERSPALRASWPVPVEPAAQALGGARGRGPIVCVLDDLPAGPFVGVVFANELLDNLTPAVFERTADGWAEVRAAVGPNAGKRPGTDALRSSGPTDGGPALVEALVPTDPGPLAALTGAVPVGARLPWFRGAQRWLQRARSCLEAGRVVCLDYGAPTTVELLDRPWLRTYRDHGPGGGWLGALGEQDVTCDVAFDQLRPDTLTRQADWLRTLGIDADRAAAAAAWDAGRARADLAALKARSRAHEADALVDPTGLGAFWVAEWVVR